MTGVLIYSILAVCRLLHFTQPIMMSCGVVIGWTYLRFYQSHGKGMRGDMGEGFSFATLLPKPLRFDLLFQYFFSFFLFFVFEKVVRMREFLKMSTK